MPAAWLAVLASAALLLSSPASHALAPASPAHRGVDSLFVAAASAYAAGRHDRADSLFVEIAARPDAPRDAVNWFLARARLGRGDTPGALEIFERLAADKTSSRRFESVMAIAGILAARGDVYGATARLWPHESDPAFGARAAYRAGELLMAAGDTPGAMRAWDILLSLHGSSPLSHRATLRLLEISTSLDDVDPFTLFAMARSAAAANDPSTAGLLLSSLARRRVDRRLRDDIALLHGAVLFRQSAYREAMDAYREARAAAVDPVSVGAADLGLVLCRLHLADSVSRAEALHRIRREGLAAEIADTLEIMAALKRVGGDTEGAQELLEALPAPSFEHFLLAYRIASDRDPEPAGGVPGARWRAAFDLAERLVHPLDRSLAAALLAERAPGSASDLWRMVVVETRNDYLLRRAARAIAFAPRAADGRDEREAAALLSAALARAHRDGAEEAMRQLRTVVLGYPGTRAATEAEGVIRGARTGREEEAGGDANAVRVARLLVEAGLPGEAADLLEDFSGGEALEMRAEAAALAQRWTSSIESAEEAQRRSYGGRATRELPERLQEWLFPRAFETHFVAAADTWKVGPAFLMALARAQTRFDPSYHAGYRLGVAGLDVEAVAFARSFPAAPALEPQDLLEPARAILLQAWLVKALEESLGETSPARLAAALGMGAGNLPPAGESRSELEEIADLPFRSARAFVLEVLEARERYLEMGIRPRPESAVRPRSAPARRR